MRKQTHFKKVVSLAVAAAMAVSVCTAALADDATNEATKEPPASEQQVEEEPSENDVDGLSFEDGKEADDGTTNDGTQTIAAGGSGQNYLSIQAAINANETTIVLAKDTAENFTVPSGHNVLLDICGHNLTNSTSDAVITVEGTLQIKDQAAMTPPVVSDDYETVTYLSGKISSNSSSNDTIVVLNHGELVVESGTIVSEVQAPISVYGNTAPNSSADKTPIASTVTIHNGYLQGVEGAIAVWGRGASANITGGVLEATDNAVVAGNGTVSSSKNNGGTTINMMGGTLIGHINPRTANPTYIACGIYQPQGGTLNVTGGTIYADGGCGIIARAGNVNVSGDANIITTGTASGWVGDNKNVLSSAAIVLDKKANYPGANASVNDEAVEINAQIKGGKFTSDADSTIEVITADGDTNKYIAVSGGMFNKDFDDSYVIDGFVKAEENGVYTVAAVPTPTPAPTATPEPTATPAPTAAPTATPAPTAAPVEVKPAAPVVNDTALKDVTPEEKEKLVEAAESATISESKELANNETVQNVAKSADDYIAADGTVKDTLNEDIQKAADASPELKAAAANDISDITLVSAPYLAVTPQKSDDGTLVFDIKLYCALKATTDPNNMTAANTCTLKTEKIEDAPVMNITLDVGKAYSGNELNTLYIRHVTESGAVYYYKAYSKGNGIIEFTNPHGFSTFTVLSDTRVAKVKLAGKEYVYDIAGIGVEFPHPDMPGYTYKGYQFDGISGSYTTLTEELFNKLAAAGETVSATATFSAIATPAPAATAAAPEATAAPTATPAPTPDDSQYYTCKDCGHHNWTATADGYKCDTCGRIETKQLSGYKNVKGTYTPTASAAAAKTTSAIPQTSDTMPIVPIAIVMIAALLGLGVTLYMKKKHN